MAEHAIPPALFALVHAHMQMRGHGFFDPPIMHGTSAPMIQTMWFAPSSARDKARLRGLAH
jgi:hypothetical protein